MGIINQVKRASERLAGAHLNWMGGPSFFLSDPVAQLRLAAASSFFGEPMYYHADAKDARPRRMSKAQRGAHLTPEMVAHLRETLGATDPQEWRGLSPSALMEKAIDAALAHDAEATLRLAVELRGEWHVRTTPQVILVRAANATSIKGTGLITKYAPQILRRADEPSVGLAYHLAAFGKPIPNSLKKAWAASLKTFDAYQVAKYRGESRLVKTSDVVSLTHAFSEPLDALMKDALRTTGETWESIVSEKGSTREVWEEALGQMGHMALLRNLRNLLEKGVPPPAFTAKLVGGVEGGKQLPFRYYAAFQAVGEKAPPTVLDALEECLTRSLSHAPSFAGRVMSLSDNSGSAWGTTTSSMGTMHVAQIANLTAVITGMRADEGYVGVFGDRLETLPVRKTDSVLTQTRALDKIGKGIGGGTENGIWLFWDQAIRAKQHWDSVFVYSDMQAGHGGLFGPKPEAYRDYVWSGQGHYIDVPKLIRTYRQRVNANVMVYLVQVAGYSDTLVPEHYDRTFVLGGWGRACCGSPRRCPRSTGRKVGGKIKTGRGVWGQCRGRLLLQTETNTALKRSPPDPGRRHGVAPKQTRPPVGSVGEGYFDCKSSGRGFDSRQVGVSRPVAQRPER